VIINAEIYLRGVKMADNDARFRSDSLNLLSDEMSAEHQQREKEKLAKYQDMKAKCLAQLAGL
jgi:hypothetical protein